MVIIMLTVSKNCVFKITVHLLGIIMLVGGNCVIKTSEK